MDFRENVRKVTGNRAKNRFRNAKYIFFSLRRAKNQGNQHKIVSAKSNLAKIAPEGGENFGGLGKKH